MNLLCCPCHCCYSIQDGGFLVSFIRSIHWWNWMSAAEAGGFFSSSITFSMQFCRCSWIASLQLDFASFKIISIFSLIEAASGSLFDRVGRGIVYSSRSNCFEYQVYQSLATLASSIALATTYSVVNLPASIYSDIDLRLVRT